MDAIKKLMGVVWIAIGLYGGYYLLISQAMPKWASADPTDKVPAIIYTFILAPMVAGSLVTFGLYSLQGEYGDDKA